MRGDDPRRARSQTGNLRRVPSFRPSPAAIEKDQQQGVTPLMLAAGRGDSSDVKHLLTNNANANAIDSYGRTALMYAVEQGHAACVELLLASNADVNTTDFYGRTALITAVKRGDVDVMELLLAGDVDVDATDTQGWTALMWAALSRNTIAVELLLTKGSADIEIRGFDDGPTALEIGIISKNINLALILLYWKYHRQLPPPQAAVTVQQPAMGETLTEEERRWLAIYRQTLEAERGALLNWLEAGAAETTGRVTAEPRPEPHAPTTAEPRSAQPDNSASGIEAAAAETTKLDQPRSRSPRRHNRRVIAAAELRDPATIDRARDILADAGAIRRAGGRIPEDRLEEVRWADAFVRRLRQLNRPVENSRA
jgi:hypothetical protein